jgi:DNA-binding LacI/PurR family transcriptional regulator
MRYIKDLRMETVPIEAKMATAALERTAKLNDVAKAAGVSQGTVSNVFNRPHLVREEVRERVRAVAKELGYRGPDPKGRLLRAGKFNAIGVATAEPLSYFFEDPFARVLMTGITEVCDAERAGISLVSAANEEELAWNIRTALVDGFVLFCLGGSDRLIELTRERQLPFVALARGQNDEAISAISIDNYGGARALGHHLGALGHRRFAALTTPIRDVHSFGPATLEQVKAAPFVGTRDRLLGYFDGLAPFGVEVEEIPILETQNNEKTVHAALEQVFAGPNPPTAILAQSDRIALIAIGWLNARGLRVPEDVSITGFDGIPESVTSDPPLTTVVQPIAEIGRRAVRAIFENDGKVHHINLDVELVVRGSTAPPRS